MTEGTILSGDSRSLSKMIYLQWNPKEDITAFELSNCLPYFFRSHFYEKEIDVKKSHFRHFDITKI